MSIRSVGPEGKRRQAGQKDECAYHIKLVRFRPPAVTQHNARPENRSRNIRKQLPNHVLAEFFCPRVRIVIRAGPVNRRIFFDHFIRALPRHGDSAHMAESPQSMFVSRTHGELNHFERASQIYIETAFLRFAVERGRAVNHGIGRANKQAVIVLAKSKARIGEVAEKNADARIQVRLKPREIHMQLQGSPQAGARLVGARVRVPID